MNFYARTDETTEWLNYLQPEGLVVGPNVLREKGLTPIRQTPLDTEDVAAVLDLPSDARREDDALYTLGDAWSFLEKVLGWPSTLVAGSPDGPEIPDGLIKTVPEHETLLSPDMGVLWKDGPEGELPAQVLVSLQPTLNADGRDQFGASEWEASPHQRLERLLRETDVGVGVLIAKNTLRLIYAPRGETSGWISWPLAALGRVEGRPMLAGLKLCLGRNALFTGAPEKRLRVILKESREAQNEVSEKLSGQVLQALHELLRGLHRAGPERVEQLAEQDSQHLYEGLLTCLMRLVFLLYAEDRDLLPSSTDPDLKTLWEGSYSIKTLYQKLQTDEALNPDTMDERRGAWGQLLAVFRIIFDGHDHWVAKRGGKLFDPDAFPFLEGRDKGTDRSDAKVLPVSDGCILRILYDLMTVEARGFSGEKIRERLSYRSLDVESIGSVYETVMGFTALRATEQMVALRDEKKLPTFIGLETLLSEKAGSRQKWLKDHSIKLSAKQMKAVKEAGSIEELLEGFGSAIDERASPKGHAIGQGTPYLQPTEERRRSGSHYTPRSLTEPIVRHALEPAFERIGTNASPEAVLALKVCDPACGSGAFLVEACRQLGARLEQAWDIHQAEKPIIPPDEDEATHARRLVAQRCLYGVDRNPMAVDLARLSLWLATLAREHEFSFLDHALKAGDSLVGLTQHEIAAAHWDASKPGLPLFRGMIKDAVDKALQGREAIRTAPDDITRAIQESRFRRVETEVEPARIVGDAIVSAFFAADKARARELERQKVESWITGHLQPRWDDLEALAKSFRSEKGWAPFHWEIEFPEVFARDNPGFNAFVGNPPFAGKNTISAASGPGYLPWLQQLHEGAHGNADLVAHFYRRAFNLLREDGAFGLIATNTIAQGDTRATGLTAILHDRGAIFHAIKRYRWPNAGAAVVVSIVHLCKGTLLKPPVLNGRRVSRISSYLVESDFDGTPSQLTANAAIAFQGSILLGKGFTFDDAAAAKGESESVATMRHLIEKDYRNQQRIFPLIGGEEVTSTPTHSYQRYAIDFFDLPLHREARFKSWFEWSDERQSRGLREGIVPQDYPGEVAEDWADLIEIVRNRVKPIRDPQSRDALRIRWWQYAEKRPGLYRSISSLSRVLVCSSKATPHHAFAFLPNGFVYSQNLNVISLEKMAAFCVIQSRVHEVWARFLGTTMKDDFTYTKDDCFETFPFPADFEVDAKFDHEGQTYYDHRASVMIASDEGMTKTYNRFHKESERGEAIQRLRELHDEMDRAVLRAYGWDELAEEVCPQFLTEDTEDDHTYQNRYFWPADQRDKVLSRLLALNAERHAEEVRLGIATKAPARDNDANDENGDDDKGAGLFD